MRGILISLVFAESLLKEGEILNMKEGDLLPKVPSGVPSTEECKAFFHFKTEG